MRWSRSYTPERARRQMADRRRSNFIERFRFNISGTMQNAHKFYAAFDGPVIEYVGFDGQAPDIWRELRSQPAERRSVSQTPRLVQQNIKPPVGSVNVVTM